MLQCVDILLNGSDGFFSSEVHFSCGEALVEGINLRYASSQIHIQITVQPLNLVTLEIIFNPQVVKLC